MRSKLSLLGTLILVLAAGVTVGRLSARLPLLPPPPLGPRPMPPWLVQALNLTAEQRQKMDAIWEQVRREMDKFGEQRHALDQKREAAILALLSEPQRAQYQNIIGDYRARRQDLDHQRQRLIDDSNQRSRALLDETQQRKWDEMTRRFHEREPRGPMGGPPGRPATTAPWGGPRGDEPPPRQDAP